MQNITTEYLIGPMLRSVVDVVSRRTSGGYASVIVGKVVKQLQPKYTFLQHVQVKSTQSAESIDAISLGDNLKEVDITQTIDALKDLIHSITAVMGKQAGYFLIREIKERLPYEYEQTIRELGVDLEMMQLQFLAERRKTFQLDINNADILRYVFKSLFDVLDATVGRNFAISTLTNVVDQYRTVYTLFDYITINDIRTTQEVDLVSIRSVVNAFDQLDLGEPLQRIIQDVANALKEKGEYAFVDKVKKQLTMEYVYVLEQLGVDLHGTTARHDLVLKNVLMALIDVLKEATSQSYAVLFIDHVLKGIDERYGYMKYIKIDSSRYSDGIDAVSVPSSVESISPTELARAIQKLVEQITTSLGDDASKDFIGRFKRRLGSAYLSKIEHMGVNLHMIQLKQDFLR